MRNRGQTQSKFLKFISIPLRALGKARDLYVRGMTGCAARAHYTSGTTIPLPRSRSSAPAALSSSSSRRSSDFGGDEDYSELIRAASVRSLGHKNEIDMLLHQQRQQSRIAAAAAKAGLPKSSSAGMARIDEDSACEFGDEGDRSLNQKVSDRLYPRSKSCAVPGSALF